MGREKQIEEIANVIYNDPNSYDTYWRSHCEQLAETLYNAGCRDQSKVIDGFAIELKEYLDDTYSTGEDVLIEIHDLIDFIAQKMKGADK